MIETILGEFRQEVHEDERGVTVGRIRGQPHRCPEDEISIDSESFQRRSNNRLSLSRVVPRLESKRECQQDTVRFDRGKNFAPPIDKRYCPCSLGSEGMYTSVQ